MEKPESCEQILEIRDNTSVTIIKEVRKDGLMIQFNSIGETKGQYQARHTETVDIFQKMDGSNEWDSRAVDMTRDGELVVITGKGVGKGATFQGEYNFMTMSPKLAWLNESKAYVEGTTDMVSNEAMIKVYAVRMAEAAAST